VPNPSGDTFDFVGLTTKLLSTTKRKDVMSKLIPVSFTAEHIASMIALLSALEPMPPDLIGPYIALLHALDDAPARFPLDI
jgi:hypothetical protein